MLEECTHALYIFILTEKHLHNTPENAAFVSSEGTHVIFKFPKIESGNLHCTKIAYNLMSQRAL